MCEDCGGKHYVVATRGDGTIAVERCDSCSWFGEKSRRNLSDIDAAKLAAKDGIITVSDYPCYVVFPASFL